jgi:hypothetical protein
VRTDSLSNTPGWRFVDADLWGSCSETFVGAEVFCRMPRDCFFTNDHYRNVVVKASLVAPDYLKKPG